MNFEHFKNRSFCLLIRSLIFFCCMFLGGCVLQSAQPIFADKDAKLLLATIGQQFVTYNKVDGKWEKQKDLIKFSQVGNHYLVHDKSGDITVLFVPLKDNWWALQATEKDKASNYLLVQSQGKTLLIYFLACKDLKAQPNPSGSIVFDHEDCSATAKMRKTEFFALSKNISEAVLRIEAVN